MEKMNAMRRTFLDKGKLYWPVVVLAVLFLYCYGNTPLVADQYVATGLYIDAGGLVNYTTGYCFWWLCNVNARFFSTLVCGIIEQSVVTNRLGMLAVLCAIPLMGMLALNTKKNRILYLLLSCASILLVSAGIQQEVYFYAGLLYLGVVVLAEAVAFMTVRLLEKKPDVRFGCGYLLLTMVASLWLESLTAALFVVYICLLLYHYVKTCRLSRWLSASVIVSGICLYMMMHQRNEYLDKQTTDIRELVHQVRQVFDVLYYDNAAVTAILSLLLALFFALQWQRTMNKVARKGYVVFALVSLYTGITHASQAYNVQLTAWQQAASLSENVNVIPSAMLHVTSTLLLPPSCNAMRFFLYLLLTLFILIAVVLQRNNLEYLILACVAIVNVGVVSVTSVAIANAMGGVGQRMVTPSLLLLVVIMAAVTAENLRPDENFAVIKVILIAATVFFLLKADDYYVRFTRVGKIHRQNLIQIEFCAEQQRLGTWDMETDILTLQSIENDLWVYNLEEDDPRYPYFCHFYHLREGTLVQYQ